MKTTSLSVAVLVALITLFSCEKSTIKTEPQPKPIQLTEKAALMICYSNKFGLDLFREVSKTEEDNLMISPLSATTALSMLLNGCGGETYTQIRDMLGYEGMETGEINQSYRSLVSQLLSVDPEIQLALANAVFYRQDFQVKPPFLDTMQKAYSATIRGLDFEDPAALNIINQWAKENTFGKIPKVLDYIDPSAVMFLMNALYFKGNWTYPFDKNRTTDAPFLLNDGSSTTVKMMYSTIPTKIYHGNGFKATELPYGQTNYSMIIMLPEGSLNHLINLFDEAMWLGMTDYFDKEDQAISREIGLPKFRFDFEKLLNDQLMTLGMVNAFDPDLANLSGISDHDIFVSFVKQNTFVEVNEEGTEAAAVTNVGIFETSMPEPFIADHPFVFIIRERTSNTILFIGKVIDPQY